MPATGSRRPLKLPIPTHIITGSLNAGKTSLLLQLLSQRPSNEVWAILVNEMGAVGVDEARLAAAEPSSGGAVVRQLAGGCLCCAMSTVTSAALVQLIRSARPDRLLIEPSGLAHPAALMDLLRGPSLQSALCIQPVICLVDVTAFSSRGGPYEATDDGSSPLLQQLAVADVLLGTKADACGDAAMAAFRSWTELYHPTKQMLACTTSAVGLEVLGLVAQQDGGKDPRRDSHSPWGSTADVVLHSTAAPAAAADAAVQPGKPMRRQRHDPATGVHTIGWIFRGADVFDGEQLERAMAAAAAAAHVVRMKGMLRVSGDAWMAVSAGGHGGSDPNTAACTSVPGTRGLQDSRLEFIMTAGGGATAREGTAQAGGSVGAGIAAALAQCDWDAVEAALLSLLVADVGISQR